MSPKARARRSAGLLAITLLASCGGGGTDPDDAETFDATLNAAAVVGTPVVSTATGVATFAYDDTNLEYVISLAGMDNVIQAHIHGPAGVTDNADILLTLHHSDTPTGMVNGVLTSGTIPPGSPQLTFGVTLDRILELMRVDSAFVMVHSTEYPDGEIRGQVIP